MSESDPPAQLELVRARVRPTSGAKPPQPATHLPVARVAVGVPLAHLDRPFDYLVPADLDESAVPGARVAVRFAGRQVSGFVLDRLEGSEHVGTLAPLRRAPSAEVVLRRDVVRLCRAVADRYAGTFADVIRLAVPPRHARVEAERREVPPLGPVPPPDPGPLHAYDKGPELLAGLADGTAPRACWGLLPSDPWPERLADLVQVCAAAGRGALVCVPDARDVARLDAALGRRLGADQHVVLTADLGPAARYRAFLRVARGECRVVIGTRAAAFAPVRDLGLVVVWDDGDDLHAEPRAPYPHVREVLMLRAHDLGCAAVIAGYARTTDAQALVDSGWCRPVRAPADRRRRGGPAVMVAGSTDRDLERDPGGGAARLPSEALQVARAALTRGPVLVQVPRAGYRPGLACQDCRTPARCRACEGPLQQARAQLPPSCLWCGTLAAGWTCPDCGSSRLRARAVGGRRTAEELGRAFPGVRVRTSEADRVLDRVDDEPALVVATPGAEPVAEAGYAAGLLLDTWATLGRPDLRAGEEAVRRWLAVAALVRPAESDGRLVVVGESAEPAVQALLRADPESFAERELAMRAETRLPPAVRVAAVTGPVGALDEIQSGPWPEPADLLGPVPVTDDDARLVIRVPRRLGPALARALQAVQSGRSARKASALRVQMDPLDLG